MTKPTRVVFYSSRVSIDEEAHVDVGLAVIHDVTVRRILVESVSRSSIEVIGVSLPARRRDYLHEVSTHATLPQLKNEGLGLKTFERLRFRIPLRAGELLTVRLDVFAEGVTVRVIAECDLGITEEGDR